MRLFLAGDTMLTRPWSDERDPRFLALVDAMRAADVTLLNLETSIHDYEGHAQPESGGSWMASPPRIAAELAWAGVDLVGHANNHSFDFGAEAVLATGHHVAKAGIVLAGSGRDLQEAAAPRFCDGPGGRVGLVAAASSFVPYGRASRSRRDLPGRPGLNPLMPDRRRALVLPLALIRPLQRLFRKLGFHAGRMDFPDFDLGPLPVRRGAHVGLRLAPGPSEADRRRVLAAVRAAAAGSDCAVFSLHEHRRPRWLRRLAHDAIAAGAGVVLVHGPHHVRGIELHDGRPIFYGLGDFVFEPWHVERIPQEFYDYLELPDDAGPAEVVARHLARGAWGHARRREVFEGLAAEIDWEGGAGGRVGEIRLRPLELGFERPPLERGRPRLAGAEAGRRIVEQVARRSRRFGTRVVWDAAAGCGRVVGIDHLK